MKKSFIYSILFFIYFTLQFTITFFESSAFIFNKLLIPALFIFSAFIAVRGRALYTKEFILYGLLFVWSLASVAVVVDTIWWWKYNQIMLGIILAHFIMIRFYRITNPIVSFNYAIIFTSFYYFYQTLFVKGLSFFQLILLHQKATVFGTFEDEKIVNPNTIGALICVAVFTSIITIYSRVPKILKVLPLAYIVLSLPMVAFTNSRSSMLTIIVFYFLYIITVVLPRKPVLSVLFFIVGFYGLIYTYNYYIKGTFIEQKMETTGKSKSDDHRLYVIKTAGELFLSNPVMGVGAGNYVKKNKLGLYTHHDFFEIASTLGVIGLILYYSIYFVIVKKLLKVYKLSQERLQKDRVKIMLCSLFALFILSNFIVVFPDMLIMTFVFNISLLITMELKKLIINKTELCVA